MRELSHTLHAFIDALHRDESVYLSLHGRWKVENRVIKYARSLFRLEVYANIRLVEAFNAVIDFIETIPVNFSSIPGMMVSQPIDFHGYLSAAQAIRRKVSTVSHPILTRLLKQLRQKTLGLLYRLEEENGGLKKTSNPELVKRLMDLSSAWKKDQKIFWNVDFQPMELRRLEEAASYTEFVKMLFEDKEIREDFFSWVLRDGLPIAPYIQYPALCQKISSNNMRGRIGRMGENLLKVKLIRLSCDPINLQKVVTLPFEGREISILDESLTVSFRGGYSLKLKQIFNVFKNKATDLGNLEIFAQGIINWNSNCLGWWSHDLKAYVLVDLDREDWWRELPILEVLTQGEASQRYGVKLDGKKWSLAAKSARESLNLDYERCHAYIEMAIPEKEGEYYIVYTFGKAILDLPRNSWHRFFLFSTYVPATIVYPDETMFFSHRQQIGYTFELEEKEGMTMMNAFREDIRRSRNGNMVFQIEAENCGKWIQVHLEEHLGNERVPNLYKFPLLQAEPTGFMAKFFSFFRGLPKFCGKRLFVLIHYPLGAWRGRWVVDHQGQRVWKSLMNSSFWTDTMTYLPAFLHKQHEIGVFSENPNKHKVWMEAPSSFHKLNDVQETHSDKPLFEEGNI